MAAPAFPHLAKKKVLLVVANMSKRNLRASVLRKLGMDVVCAGQVSDARMLWHPSTYDLVLFDIRHDDAGAVELSTDMKAESPGQRVAWLVGKPEFLAGEPAPASDGSPDISSRCEENLRQLMTNACEALPRRGGFLEARWRMALVRSLRPEQQQAATPSRLMEFRIPARRSDGMAPVPTFGDAVRQAEADQKEIS